VLRTNTFRRTPLEELAAEVHEEVCDVSDCERTVYSRGLCEPHYRRRLRTGRVGDDVPVGERGETRICMADGCQRGATERGLCHGHYLRLIRSGGVDPDRPLTRRVNTICTVEGCANPATARGLCVTHRSRLRQHGDVQADKPIRQVAGFGFESHGYWHVPVPVELRHLTNGQTPYPEHRLVMALLLGRPLTPDESVHHVNGNRRDNTTDGPLRNFRSGNLELWSRWQPSGQRVRDKVEFAISILEAYLPHALVPQRALLFED
jgi:hypothetical protein